MKTHAQRFRRTAPPAAPRSAAPHIVAPAPEIAAPPRHSFAGLAVSPAPLGAIQAKLTVGAANDQYEAEADRVAGQVMRMTDAQVQRAETPVEEEDKLQRLTPEEDEDKIQAKPDLQRLTPEEDEDTLQRLTPEEDKDTLQRMPDIQRLTPEEDEDKIQRLTPEDDEDKIQARSDLQRKATDSFEAGTAVESRIGARRGSGSPLPDATRAFMEPRFGADFSRVRIHADAEADQISRDVSARAFTTGRDIYFRQGEYAPSSSGGREILAHELTHVVQQGSTGNVGHKDGNRSNIDHRSVHRRDTMMSGKSLAVARTGAPMIQTMGLKSGEHKQYADMISITTHMTVEKFLMVIAARLIDMKIEFDESDLNQFYQIALQKIPEKSETDQKTRNALKSAAFIAIKSLIPPRNRETEAKTIEYPFPKEGVPEFLYRWCSADEASTAVKEGITKYGGIHDGIPTMSKAIKKQTAQSGGGVGIVNADSCLKIRTGSIPQIAARQPNSVNRISARNGTEYKIMVNIPQAAIERIQ